MKNIILAVLLASIGTTASALPTVFSNGKQLTEAEILLRIEQGKMPTIIGNQTYENGKFIAATDSKNPVVKAVAEIKIKMVERANNQDNKREVREAQEAAWEALGNTQIEWNDAFKERFMNGVNYSLDNESTYEIYYETEQGQLDVAAYKAALDGITYAEAEAGWNLMYGSTDPLTRADLQTIVKNINALEGTTELVTEGYREGFTLFEAAVDDLRGATTYAFKKTSGLENFDRYGDKYQEIKDELEGK